MSASATSTSPPGRTWIQRGCLRPLANGLTLSPGAATGVDPCDHPFAVGILRVGTPPWGLGGGIVGLPPKVGWGAPCERRSQIAVAPTAMASRETTSDKPIATLPRAPRLP